MNKEVEDCIEQHINSDNHQAAISLRFPFLQKLILKI